ncbi:MAG: hypothetical protein ACXVBT_03380 [Flavisolibacter sp.]
MKEKNYTGLIPLHKEGEEINVEKDIAGENMEDAQNKFATARKRLLNVNEWHRLAGPISAQFQLVDETGKNVSREVMEGDYFRIDIPGPGSKAGDGYDWVRVEELKEITRSDVQSIGFRVRPCANPLHKDAQVAHFYANTSTSTFVLTRENLSILAGVYDRNTLPNTKGATLTDQIRNSTVGVHALALFSRIQWELLAKAWLGEA